MMKPLKGKRLALHKKTQGRCAYCGNIEDEMQVDHMVPKLQGGGNELGNLILACRRCNNLKRAKTVEEFRDHVFSGCKPHIVRAANYIQRNRTYMSKDSYRLVFQKLVEIYQLLGELGVKDNVSFFADSLMEDGRHRGPKNEQ